MIAIRNHRIHNAIFKYLFEKNIYGTHKNLPVIKTFNNTVQIPVTSKNSSVEDFNSSSLNDICYSNRISNRQRLKLLETNWNELRGKFKLTESQFLSKLHCLRICGVEIDPKEFLEEVKVNNVEPSERLLKQLLAAVAEQGNPGYVASVVNAIKSRNYTADDHVFSSLIYAHAVRSDIRSTREVLDTMKDSSVKPGPLTYTSLLRAAALAGDYAAMMTTRAKITESEISLSDDNILTVLETIAKTGKEHLIPCIKVYLPLCSTAKLLNLVDSLLYSGHPNAAYSVLKLITSESEHNLYKEFLQSLFTAQISAKEITKIGRKVLTDGKYDRALYYILELYLKSGEGDEAVAVLKMCHEEKLEIRPHFFWPLIVINHKHKGDEGVFETLALMKELEVMADEETLKEMVMPRLSVTDATLRRIQDKTGLTLSNLIAPFTVHLLRTGHLDQAYALCNQYIASVPHDGKAAIMLALVSGYRNTKDHVTTAKFIKLFKIENIGDWLVTLLSSKISIPAKDCLHLFQELKKTNASISSANQRHLIRILSRMQIASPEISKSIQDLVQASNFNNANNFRHFPHPSEMKTEELECHLLELENKGMNTRGVLRRLVQEHCRDGNVVHARRYYKRLLDAECDLSPGIVASMMQVNILAGELEDALAFFQKLVEEYPRFKVDCYKIVDLATLLAKSQRIQDAISLLDSNEQRAVHAREAEKWERNCWMLLTAVVEGGDELLVKKVLDVLLRNNYCHPTNVTLGPLIKIYLKSGNIEEAAKVFCECAAKYRKTPLQQEVMTAIIKTGDVQLLDQVVSSASQVHGENSSRASLIASYALCGNTDQMKNNLQNVNDGITEQLRSRILRMRDLEQIEALQTFLTVYHEISYSDVDFVVDCIVYHFNRTGDTEGAIKMWSLLESKNIKLEEKHKASLAALVAGTVKLS